MYVFVKRFTNFRMVLTPLCTQLLVQSYQQQNSMYTISPNDTLPRELSCRYKQLYTQYTTPTTYTMHVIQYRRGETRFSLTAELRSVILHACTFKGVTHMQSFNFIFLKYRKKSANMYEGILLRLKFHLGLQTQSYNIRYPNQCPNLISCILMHGYQSHGILIFEEQSIYVNFVQSLIAICKECVQQILLIQCS